MIFTRNSLAGFARKLTGFAQHGAAGVCDGDVCRIAVGIVKIDGGCAERVFGTLQEAVVEEIRNDAPDGIGNIGKIPEAIIGIS